MAIASPLRGTRGRSSGGNRVASWFSTLHDALERPLTSYYLLLGASALLLIIGLIMVFSASSVYAFQNYNHDSYAVVVKQLTWVAIGLPCAWIAGRLPQRWVRRLAWLVRASRCGCRQDCCRWPAGCSRSPDRAPGRRSDGRVVEPDAQ